VSRGGNVWVAELHWLGGSWMSIHRSKGGALSRMTKHAKDLGIHLDLIDLGIDTVNSYGLSLLPVEP
jgi:hypothetical protein